MTDQNALMRVGSRLARQLRQCHEPEAWAECLGETLEAEGLALVAATTAPTDMTANRAVALYSALFGMDDMGVDSDEECVVRTRSTHFRACVEGILGADAIPHERTVHSLGTQTRRAEWLDRAREELRPLGQLLEAFGRQLQAIGTIPDEAETD